MKKYQIFKKKLFESLEKYESRLNEECRKGWRPIGISNDHSAGTIILLEKSS